MKVSILIPHWRSGRMTAYSVSQFLKYTVGRNVEIIVINNSYGDDSIKYLEPFKDKIRIIHNISDKTSSHGTAFDLAIPLTDADWIFTAESDSFPVEPFLQFYVELANQGYDAIGSVLSLSGGTFLHPTGTAYKRSIWEDAKRYCDNTRYTYFPGIALKDSVGAHLMVREDFLNEFLGEPEDYIELTDSYRPYTAELAMRKAEHYKPIVSPFHNGCGKNNETKWSYGQRTIGPESSNILLDNRLKIITRFGMEPGQWLSYYMEAAGYKTFHVSIETKWMPDREMQQQEYTLSESGIKHLWAGSSFLSMKDTAMHDVYEFKKNQIDELYNSLPEHFKIKE